MAHRKPGRLHYEIRRESSGFGTGRVWVLVAPDGETTFSSKRKLTVVNNAAEWLTFAWETLGLRTELTIKRVNQSIQDKRTYGADPRRTRG